MIVDVDKIVVSLDVVAPDAVVVEASAVAPSGIVTEAVAELPTQVVVISHEETPTISPLQIIDYGSSSIECAFDVTTEQAEEVVRGVLCGTINPPTFENADYRLLHGQGSMDLAFAGLHRNTEYYLRPYSLSNLGYKYGDVVAQRTKTSPIPNEYQLVEWLKTDGFAFILLNRILTPNTKIEFIGRVDENKNGSFFGCYNPYEIYGWNVSPYMFIQFGGTYKPIPYPMFVGVFNEHIIDFRIHTVTIDNFIFEYNVSVPSVGNYIALFISYQQNDRRNGMNSISMFKWYESNIKILDLYPVYRIADSKPGMYDLVNNVFYTNQGSGEFVVGPDTEWNE